MTDEEFNKGMQATLDCLKQAQQKLESLLPPPYVPEPQKEGYRRIDFATDIGRAVECSFDGVFEGFKLRHAVLVGRTYRDKYVVRCDGYDYLQVVEFCRIPVSAAEEQTKEIADRMRAEGYMVNVSKQKMADEEDAEWLERIPGSNSKCKIIEDWDPNVVYGASAVAEQESDRILKADMSDRVKHVIKDDPDFSDRSQLGPNRYDSSSSTPPARRTPNRDDLANGPIDGWARQNLSDDWEEVVLVEVTSSRDPNRKFRTWNGAEYTYWPYCEIESTPIAPTAPGKEDATIHFVRVKGVSDFAEYVTQRLSEFGLIFEFRDSARGLHGQYRVNDPVSGAPEGTVGAVYREGDWYWVVESSSPACEQSLQVPDGQSETAPFDWSEVPDHLHWVTWSPYYRWKGWVHKPGLEHYPSGSWWANGGGFDAKFQPNWADYLGDWHNAIFQRPQEPSPAPQSDKGECERELQIKNLATLVRRMARFIRRSEPANELADKALAYLERKGIAPLSVLREGAETE